MEGQVLLGERSPRRLWVAWALSFALPGLGHLYCGRLRRGVIYAVVCLALVAALVLTWAHLLLAPQWPVAFLGLAWLLFQWQLCRELWLIVSVEGAQWRLRPTNHPIVYGAFALSLGLVPGLVLHGVVADHMVGSVRVADATMFPTLLAGDEVLFDRRGFAAHAPGVGELVVIRSGPGRAGRMARVVAVGGQRVALRDGRPEVDGALLARREVENLRVHRFGETREAESLAELQGYVEQSGERRYLVTHFRLSPARPDEGPYILEPGELFVIGDNRDVSLDTGAYGRVPADAVLGRPRRIWASTDLRGRRRSGRVGWAIEGLVRPPPAERAVTAAHADEDS